MIHESPAEAGHRGVVIDVVRLSAYHEHPVVSPQTVQMRQVPAGIIRVLPQKAHLSFLICHRNYSNNLLYICP
jgi:hypothetical protein